MSREKKELDPADLLGGKLSIFGLNLDLGELLASPENLKGHLEELREKLKEAGGKETLSDEEWRRGGTTVAGYIRTRGLLGEQEFHIGTAGEPRRRESGQREPEPPEAVEPPLDVFDEGNQVTIVADVPGVSLDELELKVVENLFSLSTRASARRSYRKELQLEADLDPDSIQASCHNGLLEVHLRKRETVTAPPAANKET